MRIVQIITGAESYGGAEAHVRDLSIGLRARGHECSVLAGPPEGLLAEQLRANGIPVFLVPALRKPMRPFADAASVVQVRRLLQHLKPDVIATHTSKAGFIGRFAARTLGVPCFFTPHGLSFINRHSGKVIRFRLLLEQVAARFGGEIIAVCDAERELILNYLGDTGVSISTIHNGIPDRQIAVTKERERSKVIITMIARFEAQKDHETLVRALSMLKHLDWELRLAGTGLLLESVRQLVNECGLADRVKFLMQCGDTPRLLAESDIYTLITHYEAFPISILEAMRAGLPVIASDTGGVGEAVQEKSSGFLVSLRDASQLAERLASLILSSDLRQTMGAQSRRRFSQMFEWSSMLNKTEALYMKALRREANETVASTA